MRTHSAAPPLKLPRGWPRKVRSAVLHATSLAATALAADYVGELEEGRARLRQVYSVEDPEEAILGFPEMTGRSPANFRARGLAEWVLDVNPQARIVSVSGKDRAAIALALRTTASLTLSGTGVVRGKAPVASTAMKSARRAMPGFPPAQCPCSSKPSPVNCFVTGCACRFANCWNWVPRCRL